MRIRDRVLWAAQRRMLTSFGTLAGVLVALDIWKQ